MKLYYTIGDFIPEKDPRTVRLTPRILGFEIEGSLKRLKEMRLVENFKEAEEIAKTENKSDAKKPVIKICIIEESLKTKTADPRVFLVENDQSNVFAVDGMIDITDGYQESEIIITNVDGTKEREKNKTLAKLDFCSMPEKLESDLKNCDKENPHTIIVPLVNLFKRYGTEGMKVFMPTDLPAMMLSLSKVFFSADGQKEALNMANTLHIHENDWDLKNVAQLLIEEYHTYLKNNKLKDNKTYPFVQLLKSCLVFLLSIDPSLQLQSKKNGEVEKTPLDFVALTASCHLLANELRKNTPPHLQKKAVFLAENLGFFAKATNNPKTFEEINFTLKKAIAGYESETRNPMELNIFKLGIKKQIKTLQTQAKVAI